MAAELGDEALMEDEMTEPRDAEAVGEDDGPTLEEAKEALEAHVEEPEPEAAELPTDVKDDEAGEPGQVEDDEGEP